MKKLLIVAMAATVAGANAQVLQEQLPGTIDEAFVSQEFPDFTDFSTWLFDDVTNAVPWTITRVRIDGRQTGTLSNLTSFHLRFQSNASATNRGTIGLSVDVDATNPGPHSYAGGDITFDLGAGMNLDPGSWFISVWVVSPFQPNNTQWNWDLTETVQGDDAWVHNPGGGFIGELGTTNPRKIAGIDLGEGPYPPVDLVFTIEGTAIPEPGTFVAIGIGLAGLAFARRRK